MRTELPAERLQRRLGAEVEPDTDDEDRQPDTSLTRWLPDTTGHGPAGWIAAARADPGRAGVLALGGIGVLAVLITVFVLVRDDPPAVAAAKLPPVQMVSSASPTPSAASDEPVVVSVVGLVHKPGSGHARDGRANRRRAHRGGRPLDGADLVGLNMARRIADGEQIVVGIEALPGEPAALGSSVSAGTAATASPNAPPTGVGDEPSGGKVDLNTATVEQLDTLPGIGPVTAAAIVAWRDANGRFTSVDQLGDVDGIGPARLEKLRDLVHV